MRARQRGGEAERILVVAPAWVGDAVMTQSLVQVLRERAPGARIDLLSRPGLEGLVGRMPGVDGAVSLPLEHGELGLGVRWRTARKLRGRRYGRAVITKRSLKASLVPWMAGIPRRTGYLGEMRFGLINDRRTLDEEALPLWVQRVAVLGQEPGEEPLAAEAVPRPRLRSDPARQARLRGALGLEGERRDVVALAPGAEFGPAKRWPVERWAELARALTRSGRGVWIFGSSPEREVGAAVAGAGGEGARDLTGRTELADVVDLMALCGTTVTNDSGLMHLAAAVGSGVVALFGPTDPGYTPPLTERARVLRLDLPCSPCHEPVCPLGHHDCLRGLPVEVVLEAVP